MGFANANFTAQIRIVHGNKKNYCFDLQYIYLNINSDYYPLI